ncbi:hypothetical protein D9758_018041 [Tetrapyrgos nigripes]|nr:hypothetical protein D9758_018041 [Tetrapyrgos nigripes]
MASFGFLSTLLDLLFKGLKPGPTRADITPYAFPPTTKDNLEYADLAIIDLSKMSTPEGRKELTAQLSRAMHETGFFYVINHGYTQEQTNRIFSIANLIFDDVSDEEKALYTGKSPTVYEGYKPKQTWKIQEGVRDQIEHYNLNRKVDRRTHPEPVRPYLKEIQDFAYHNHHNVLYPVLRLLAAGLELPEDTLVKQHQWDAASESSGSVP